MTNILSNICDDKRAWVAECKVKTSLLALEERVKTSDKPRGFATKLKADAATYGTSIIAEIKKASPSKGLIREDFSPKTLAQSYENGGASCLSVLTDIPYFQGHDDYLIQARAACALPALRKDFMVDPYQIVESRVLGADAILIIMAALSVEQAKELEDAAHKLGMDSLVEVHNEQELEDAIAHLNPSLLGINNRNLKTMEINLSVTERLVRTLPEHHNHTIVCESGIYDHTDITRMHQSDVHSFLVGESLMRQDNVELALKNLLNRNS